MAVLLPRVTELAARWRARASVATPRRASAADVAGDDDDDAIVRAIVSCLDRDARWAGEVIRHGWASGAAAHASGLAVHHVLKDADLLLAILLAAVEDASREGTLAGGSVADAFAVARRLQFAVGLHAQASASSYLHALVGAMRARWRVLRHDLRNPLGTIRSALSLMEDEKLPAEARTGPRVRAMLARNAGSLETLIAAELDGRVAESLVSAPQEVSLRDVALAVRRTLRDTTRLAECEIVVDDALPSARVDEAALELALSALLLAGLAHARPGDVLRVSRAPDDVARGGRAALRVLLAQGVWDPDGLALASSIAGEHGGRVAAESTAVDLALPLLSEDEGGAGHRAERRPRGSDRHVRDDVARAD